MQREGKQRLSFKVQWVELLSNFLCITDNKSDNVRIT